MAETVNIFGRKLPKNGVYIAGAVAVGVIGYAWWTRGTAINGEEETEEIEDPLAPVEPPTDTPGFSLSPGGPPPMTNAEWTELARERLSNQGVVATSLYSALGKFLARVPMSKVEADLVRQALAVAGPPPQNGPFAIIEEATGGSTTSQKPGQPGFLRGAGGRGYAQLNWFPASGHVMFYEVKRNDVAHWLPIGNVTSFRANALVRKDTRFTYSVRAVGPGNARGNHSSVTVTVKR